MSLLAIPSGSSSNVSGGFYPKTIGQSLRFNDDDSAYLSKTDFGTSTNTAKRTFSTWIKSCDQSYTTYDHIIGAGSASIDGFGFSSDAKLQFLRGGSEVDTGTRVIRDPGAWYHIMFTWDSTAGEWYIYVNGEQDSTGVAGGALSKIGQSGQTNTIMKRSNASQYIHGYLAETVFLDGYIGDVNDFGEFKENVWVPKNISAAGLTYGNNGFYLDYADSTDLGKDVSGQGNHWTANNLAASDVVLDSPTNNFCTWNPLEERNQKDIVPPDDFTGTLSEGNLEWDSPTCSTRNHVATSTFWVGSGKWYWEGVMTRDSGGQSRFAMGTKYFPTRYDWFYASTASVGTVYGIKVDLDTNSLQYTTDGITYSNFTADGSNSSSLGDYPLTAMFVGCNSAAVANFGQDSTFAGNKTAGGNTDSNGIGDFYYTPPSGFLALSTANLTAAEAVDPAQDNSPQDYFNPVLYAGTSTTNSVTGVGFQPDFVWIKDRSTGNSHAMFDVVRGTSAAGTTNTAIGSNRPDAEGNGNGVLSSFNTDGFTVDDGSSGSFPDTLVNDSPDNYVAWNWNAGGSTTSGTATGGGGSRSYSYRASQDSGVSIVIWTGDGTDGGQVPHGLTGGVDTAFVKRRDSSLDWHVWHSAMPSGEGYFLSLNKTDGEGTTSYGRCDLNDSGTALTFHAGANGMRNVNLSGATYVAYVFKSVEGFSKFGSYTGYQITDGPFVYTGFRPAFLLVKNANFAEIWPMWDAKRDPENPVNLPVYANLTNNESTAREIDFLSNGFKIRNADTSDNRSGDTHIYWAFAENPFKYANAR